MEDVKAQQLEALYRTERSRLERIAMHRVGPSGASDVVHDVFTTLWARAQAKLILTPAYLAQATKFTAISHFRSASRRAAFFQGITEEQYAPAVPLPEQVVADRADLRRVEAALAGLPQRTRQVFLLNRVHGCTYEEIAFGLGLSSSTVERDMAKALLACRACVAARRE